MFKLSSNSVGFEVTHRVFGKQDRGIRPKGANDQTSFKTAWALLGKPSHFLCYEIFFAKEIIFQTDLIFVLTGAHYHKMILNNTPLKHATVYKAAQGDTLHLQTLTKGFRIYLMATAFNPQRVAKQSRGYHHYFPKQPSTIRVTQGPEYNFLQEDFFQHNYMISHQSDLSGLRLDRELKAKQYDIITNAVTDGTIQLTQKGAIILMRHRQSTGGYPRIFNVIEADMDRLAQFPHGSYVTFEQVTHQTACTLLLQYERYLGKMYQDLR